MAKPNGLTELESCTLGVIRHHQPCSTYQVRQVFARSPTTEWSASAGSIYPVIERLLRLKLVKAESRRGDGRGRRDLTVTAKGARAADDWILGLEPWVARATADPIRTRVYFLASVESARRADFLSRAEALTTEMIDQLRALAKAERESSQADYLATIGTLFQLDARLRWLREVRKAMAGEGAAPTRAPRRRTTSR